MNERAYSVLLCGVAQRLETNLSKGEGRLRRADWGLRLDIKDEDEQYSGRWKSDGGKKWRVFEVAEARYIGARARNRAMFALTPVAGVTPCLKNRASYYSMGFKI